MVILLFLLTVNCSEDPQKTHSWIRINQLGYKPDAVKAAVVVSKENPDCRNFRIYNAENDTLVMRSDRVVSFGAWGAFKSSFRLDFSAFNQNGRFYIMADDVRSPDFTIDQGVYNGTADFLLRYMRQQRCGFNPFLKDSCHTNDGYTVYGPKPDGTRIDVVGGWHDASDYLQYVATSANAVYNLLMAYQEHPEAFSDAYRANGLAGSNAVPDVMDEALWGLQWLAKMHPRPDWMFNQIADDRDHAGFRLPTEDTVRFDYAEGRPVYFCTGDPQGLFDYQNRATGVASTAGKFASAFALAARVLKSHNGELAQMYSRKARSAYTFGKADTGVCQTAPCKAPYFYEEDNWVDDMELAAIELFKLSGKTHYRREAVQYAEQEPVTPWMDADTARHYQWYPFLNLGHYQLAKYGDDDSRRMAIESYRQGIEAVWQKGRENPFFNGVPSIWCSNNLTAAMATQCYLYRTLSGDSSYIRMEAALRDWLFGCNPWGVSMVIGLPEKGRYPKDPHSALTHLYGYQLDGGLVDGPVYGGIFRQLKYVNLREDDEYTHFQSDLMVYHDDVGDYATNEPTMDGTASLVYYLAAMVVD